MASLLVGWLAVVAVRFFVRSVADDVSHCVLVAVAILDHLIALVFDKRVQVLDLSACQAAFLGVPLSVFYNTDLPEPLLLCNTVRWLNVLLARLNKVALGGVMVAKAM
eukprot:10566941-Ditylum_brightwellii.AAC.1